MNVIFKRSPALIAAGLLACTAIACGDATDTSPDDSTAPAQAGQALEAVAATASAGADARGNLDELSRLIADADVRSLNEALSPLYATRGPVQLVTQGPIIDYADAREPVYIRHPNSPDLHLLIAAGAEFKLKLRDTGGRLQDVSYAIEEVDGGMAELRILASDLPAAGVLLLGTADADLEALGDNVFALAVLDEPLSCEGAERECASDDVACMLQAHSSCITSNFDAMPALHEDASPAELITDYVDDRSVFGSLSVESFDEERGTVTLKYANPARPERALMIMEDGSQKPLEFEQLGENLVRVKAPEEGFSAETLLALQAPGDGIGNTGIVIAPIFGWFFPDKTWKYSGCLKFENQAEFTQNTTIEPLHNIDVRVSTTVDGIFYRPWATTRTNSQGCFSISRKFTGMFAGAKRRARIQYRLRDGHFATWNTFSFDGLFRQGFSIVKEVGWHSHSSSGYNAGNMIFAPGQPGALGQSWRREQAVSFDAMRRIDQAAGAQNSWLRFNGPVMFHYPVPFNNVGIAPPNPANVLSPINPFPTAHGIFVSENWWDISTVVHETAHTWHYKHKSGNIPNIVTSLINGWNTHNCQEDDNVAFLEGFAEYFAHEALCGAIFNSAHCDINSETNPLSMPGLTNDATCVSEGQAPLDSVYRTIRQDDGVTHGLKLLTADNFARRNFQFWNAASWEGHAPVDPWTTLPTQCYWSNIDYDFWDLLWTFKADPSKGFSSHFSIAQGNDLLDFFNRFAAIHEVHPHFLNKRTPFLNPLSTHNPADSCFKRCTQPAIMANGQPMGATEAPNHCEVTPAPASVNVQVSGRTWYTQKSPVCPVGNYDGANCHVLTPAPGVSPFIWQGHLYTTALPGGVCPDGWFDGANCQIAQPIPGHQPFIWQGMLYFTAQYACPAGVSVGGNMCLIGTTPPGTTAAVTGGNMLSYIE
ncbi:hypothetical protein FRC98_07295 [Lujinxingia vulgaris]|uniref:Peptidase M60 domain-containing protein n=1 Tax=Lujinxingia vulgaris TaxID=2600176 RepID=A0A5C6XAK0_9DELT|nr:hypothetical protein [Lujinxingia vulgaris]TXD37490.1 hypothetical protein FRC98_07295 [Lujinxingia vulgaris]